MFQLYAVLNRANTSRFIAASNEDRAKAVAIKLRHSKKEKNLRVTDITQKMTTDSAWSSLQAILVSEREGELWKQVPAYTFTEIIAGVNHGGGQWIIQETR